MVPSSGIAPRRKILFVRMNRKLSVPSILKYIFLDAIDGMQWMSGVLAVFLLSWNCFGPYFQVNFDI